MVALEMSILLWVLGVLVVAIGGLCAFAATKPDQMAISRTINVSATPDKVYPLIANFHNWRSWSPWEKLDPNLERSYSGAEDGVGAHYSWKGNKKVGSGEMTIVEATSPSRVLIKLHFIAPWETTNSTEFTIKTAGTQTEVGWHMRGPSPFMVKVMGVVFNMDKAIGKDFESGLAAMKTAAENA